MEKLISIELRNYTEKNDALNLIKWLSDFDVIQYMNEDQSMITTLNNILNNIIMKKMKIFLVIVTLQPNRN